jgi:2-desacetyl-2-hydroxyethyl bacteriochlorophyllide A dehydrogenase
MEVDVLKAIYLEGDHGYGLYDRPMPVINPNQVLVKVKYAAICHTDIIIKDGVRPFGPSPFIPGHEFCGEIVETGGEVWGLKIGDKGVVRQIVVCGHCRPCLTGKTHQCEQYDELGVKSDGGFAEYCAVPAGNFHKLPDGISLEDVVLCEPLANAVSAVRRADIRPNEAAVVIGPGAIGLMCLQVAGLLSPSRLILVGTRDERLAVGKQVCPQAECVNIRKENQLRYLNDVLLEGHGAHSVIECSGTRDGMELAFSLLGHYGTICFEGSVPHDATIPFTPNLLRENGNAHGICGWEPQDFQAALDLIVLRKVATLPLITHRFPLTEWPEAFELATNRKNESIRILLEP